MKTLGIILTGVRPLIMHNGSLADPTNPYTIKIKEITSKGSKKMTVADHEDRDRFEWEGGLYWDEEANCPHIPTDNIERMIQFGARKSRKGKDCEAVVMVDDEIVPLIYKGPKDRDKLFGDGRTDFVIRKGVVIARARIIRVRPVFKNWSLKFSLSFDETILNEKDLRKAIEDAGSLVGLGDFRPKYGRFEVEYN